MTPPQSRQGTPPKTHFGGARDSFCLSMVVATPRARRRRAGEDRDARAAAALRRPSG